MMGFKKFFKNNKGATLIEIVVSLAVLGIISVPLFTTFLSSALIIRRTGEQLEINAVTRIVKENVVASVKYGGGNVIPSYETDEYGTEIEVVLKGCDEANNLKVLDSMGKVYDKYKFDVKREKDYGEIPGYPDTCQYIITLKTFPGDKIIQKVRININRLD